VKLTDEDILPWRCSGDSYRVKAKATIILPQGSSRHQVITS
jgi:hypothetical protein